jgi:beta-xylosidase
VYDYNNLNNDPNRKNDPVLRRCIMHAESTAATPVSFNIVEAPLCAGTPNNKPYSVIDVSVFLDENKQPRYLLYKDNLFVANGDQSRIVLRTIGQNGSLSGLGPPKHVLTADRSLGEGNSVEAPTLIKKDGIFYLFYSYGTYNLDTYGVAVARSKDPLLIPFERQVKSGKVVPVLTGLKDPDTCGVGHQDVSPNGDWIFYHAYVNQPHTDGGQCLADPERDRHLLWDNIKWVGSWPVVNNGKPALTQ